MTNITFLVVALSNNVELLNVKQIYNLSIMMQNINVLRGKLISYRGTVNDSKHVKSTCIESVFHFGGYKEQRQRGGAAFFLGI